MTEPLDESEPIRVPITLKEFLLSIFVLALALVIGVTALVAIYLRPIFDRQERNAEIAVCNAQANGDVWQAIAATFDTPPSPADARTKAVKKIQEKAKEFDRCR